MSDIVGAVEKQREVPLKNSLKELDYKVCLKARTCSAQYLNFSQSTTGKC